MRLEELDFDFYEELIAQAPSEPRDSCRLMIVGTEGTIGHRVFADLPDYLRPGDTLVFNDSKVLPARVVARKPSGGVVELLFLRPFAGYAGGNEAREAEGSPDTPTCRVWEALARPSHRLRSGGTLVLPGGEVIQLLELLGEGRWSLECSAGISFFALMERYGTVPLPPYIKKYLNDPSSYQTVYASTPGSAAAPTAGLHFTPSLLERLRSVGVRSAYVTLHVGLDTFLPIREQVIEKHRMHREAYSVSESALATIRSTVLTGGRLVAVGTTATRVLETLAAADGSIEVGGGPLHGTTEIFLTPGHRFRAVQLMLTNFHLPRSTVLALVMAFAGAERIRHAYAEAISNRYRFFSFGDAMLLEPADGLAIAGGQSV